MKILRHVWLGKSVFLGKEFAEDNHKFRTPDIIFEKGLLSMVFKN
jgi:hypothetical protein